MILHKRTPTSLSPTYLPPHTPTHTHSHISVGCLTLHVQTAAVHSGLMNTFSPHCEFQLFPHSAQMILFQSILLEVCFRSLYCWKKQRWPVTGTELWHRYINVFHSRLSWWNPSSPAFFSSKASFFRQTWKLVLNPKLHPTRTTLTCLFVFYQTQV